MEFDRDIAVIQGALQLADKLCNGRLHEMTKSDIDSKIREVLNDAILEVVKGLTHDLDPSEQQNQRFKVTSILVATAMKSQDVEDHKEDYWYAVTVRMPRVSLDVLIEIIKSCHLQFCFFKILNHLKQELGARIMNSLVQYIQNKPDDLDVTLYIDLIEHLFLTPNPYVFTTEGSGVHHKHDPNVKKPPLMDVLCDQLGKLDVKSLPRCRGNKERETHVSPAGPLEQDDLDLCLTSVLEGAVTCCQAVLNRDITVQRQTRILMSMANFYTSIMNKEALLVTDTNFLSVHLESFLKSYLRIQKKTSLSHSEVEDLFLQFQDRHVYVAELIEARSALKPSIKLLGAVCDNLEKVTTFVDVDLSNEGLINNVNQVELKKFRQMDGECGKVVQSTLKRLVSERYFQSILRRLCENYQNDTKDYSGDEALETKMGNILLKCEKLLISEKGLAEERKTIKEDKMWEWCIVAVTCGLHGTEELLSCLLEEDIPPKIISRWLQCLEANLHLLTSAPIMIKWLTLIQRQLDQKTSAPVMNTLRMVTLAVYKKLPLVEQNSLIKYVHQNFDSARLFGVDQRFETSVTIAFNRLINSKADLLKSTVAVSSLALQSPEKILKKMVDDAIRNNGQAKLLSEILEHLPDLCHLKSRGHVTILGELIGHAATWELSRTEEQNLLTFVTLLLKETANPLLNPGEVLDHIILPNLTFPDSSQGQGPPKVSFYMALSLLRASLEMNRDLSSDWIIKCNLVPLLACLCEMIDRCGSLWEEPEGTVAIVGGPGKDVIKEILVDVTQLLVTTLTKHRETISGKSLTWLYTRLQLLHWTSELYVAPLFSAVNGQEYPTRYPDALTDLLDITDLATVHRGGDSVYLLLDLCRVTDEAAAFASSRLQHNTLRGDRTLYSRVIAALVVLIPQSLPRECERMMKCIVAIVIEHSLVPQNDTPPKLKFLSASSEGAVTELRVGDIMNDVLSVLRTSISQETPLQASLHIAKCHVTILKTFCLDAAMLDRLDKSTGLFVLVQNFCRLCHQMAYFPEGPAEPLFVLLLDVLQTYGKARSSLDDTQNSRMKEELANQIEAMRVAAEQCQLGNRTMLIKKLEQGQL